ncbi:helix-turn-helix transcriptional regulator [Cellulosimicrobium funkei]|uniref:helix-turn-helix transcriptional regulator n=1 Tax=Cellulosimicrobium funkei TaxID=264251 RepID=UPI0003980925
MIERRKPWAPWEENFRSEMRRLREKRGVTQTEMARRLKDRGLSFHQQTVQRVESGERPIRLDEAYLIAEELGVDLMAMATSPANPSEREVRYAVDSYRRQSMYLNSELPDVLDPWYGEVAILVATLRELLGDGPEPTPSPSLAWTAAWVRVGLQAYDHAMALNFAAANVQSDTVELLDRGVRGAVDPLVSREGWALVERADAVMSKVGEGLTSRSLARLDGPVLYALLSDPDGLGGWQTDIDPATRNYFRRAGSDGERQEEA